MEQTDIQRYIDLRKQIEDLEAQLEELKPNIVDQVHQHGDKIEIGDYVLRSQVSRSWTYTDAVDELQKQLTEKKRQEVAEGAAQLKKESRFVVMLPAKKSTDSPPPKPDDDIPY